MHGQYRIYLSTLEYLVKVKKKPLQKPCTNNLAQRRIQKDRDQSKYIKLKMLQSRRLLQGLIKTT